MPRSLVLRVLLPTTIACLPGALPANAGLFDDQRQGVVTGLGIGFAPLVSAESRDLQPGTSDSAPGFTLGVIVGIGVTSTDVLAFQGRSVDFTLGDWDAKQSQFFRGAAWFHTFGDPGRSLVANLGVGAIERKTDSYSPCPECPAVFPPEGTGIGYQLGVGYEFRRRWHVMAYGLLGRFDDPSQGDWTTRQLDLEIQYSWY